MTRRVRLFIAGLLAAGTTAAVFATPVVYAGIILNALTDLNTLTRGCSRTRQRQ